MAGLPWVKVATDFMDDPKALALAHRLSDPRAPLHLPAIWGHFARHYADGSMPDTEDAIRALERAALWVGPAGALVEGLLAVGLLERKRKRVAVHAWGEWQEGHARKLERDRARMRAKRAEHQGNGRATVERGSRDRRGTEEMERREEEDTPSLRSGGDAAAPAAAPPEQAATAPSEFQTVVRHWFAAWERAGRGKHTSLTGADGLNLKRLVRELGAGEVMARMDRALSDPWFLERADLALFFRQRNRFASPGRAAAPVAADWGRMAAAMRGPELRAIGEELFRRSATFPQLGRAVEILADVPGTMVGDVLVLEARDEFQRQRLADSVGQLLLEIAPDVLGRAVSIDVVTRLHTAAGVAR